MTTLPHHGRSQTTPENTRTGPRLSAVPPIRTPGSSAPSRSPASVPHPVILPLVVFTVALVYHGWSMGTPGLWRDEVATISATRHSWSSLFAMMTWLDAVHAIYYTMMKLWTSVAGTGPVAMRLPSAVAVALSAAVVAVIGRRMAGSWFGLCAAIAFLLLPRTGWSALEARSAAIAVLTVALAIVTLQIALDRNQIRNWVWFGIAICVSVLVFVHNILALAALPLLLIGQDRERLKRFGITVAAAGVAALPLVLEVVSQSAQVSWIRPLSADDAVQLLPELLMLTDWGDGLAWLVTAIIGVGAVLAIALNRRVLGSRQIPTAVFMIALSTLPWLVLMIVTLLGKNLYYPRYAIAATIGFSLLLACVLSVLRPRYVGLLMIGVLLVVAIPRWADVRSEEAKEQSQLAAQYLSEKKQPGDAVLYTTWIPRTNETTKIVEHGYPDRMDGLTDLTVERSAYEMDDLWDQRGALAAHQGRLDGVDRVWVLGTNRQRNDEDDLVVLTEAGFASAGDPVKYKPFIIDLWVRDQPAD